MISCITLQRFMVLNTANNEDTTLSYEQKVVFNWLNDELQLPVYADVYRGACDLFNRQSPGYIVFVCHAARDLMNGLAPTVRGRKRLQVDYVGFFDDLENCWKDEWGAQGLNNKNRAKSGHLIPHKICRKLKKMIAKHKAGRPQAKRSGSSFLHHISRVRRARNDSSKFY